MAICQSLNQSGSGSPNQSTNPEIQIQGNLTVSEIVFSESGPEAPSFERRSVGIGPIFTEIIFFSASGGQLA